MAFRRRRRINCCSSARTCIAETASMRLHCAPSRRLSTSLHVEATPPTPIVATPPTAILCIPCLRLLRLPIQARLFHLLLADLPHVTGAGVLTSRRTTHRSRTMSASEQWIKSLGFTYGITEYDQTLPYRRREPPQKSCICTRAIVNVPGVQGSGLCSG